MAPAAQATEGYFALGHSPAQRAQSGAGVANGSEPMSATINPAGVAELGHQMQLGAEFFMPDRGYEGTATGFVPSGVVTSAKPLFLVPSFAYNLPLQNGAVFNLAVYGNGGMNSTYRDPLGGCGSVFCGGPAGVDLIQLFASATYAQKFGNVSVGIAPTFAFQGFKADGLGAFAGISTDPTALTGNGYDYSVGAGLRGGIQVDVTDSIRVGVAGQSKMYMTEFDSYSGLFENGGDFDIPASVSAGIAVDLTPSLTVMADWRRIFYSDVGAIGNATTAGALGAPGGAGFGWDDVDAVKFAVEWRQSDVMTWRAGYAQNSNPIGPEDVTFNILAPAVVEKHISFGGSRRINDTDAFDFSITYSPEVSVSGPEMTPLGPTGGTVAPYMSQISASIGFTKTF
ncbi:MAG: outer membrane protein transport protein [Maritimibacter sp.]|nr:outer membrane protein transport protein [Maritimibacter sp.]